jgi:hypothetical protein
MPLAWVRGQFFGAHGSHLHGRRGRLCPLSLVVVLLALVPLADANPPDPLWVRGVYDAADLDEIVMAVSSLAGVVKGILLSLEKPFAITDATVSPAATAPAQLLATSALHTRAPPT